MSDAHAHRWRLTAHVTAAGVSQDRYLCTVDGCREIRMDPADYAAYLARNPARG